VDNIVGTFGKTDLNIKIITKNQNACIAAHLKLFDLYQKLRACSRPTRCVYLIL